MQKIIYDPIGLIHSPFKKPEGVPIQGVAVDRNQGMVELFEEYSEGLTDLEGFSHVYLLYHFHLSKAYTLKVKPYLDNRLHGLFATRAPSRPNSIGLSIVELIKIEGLKLHIANHDIVDGTPLLDIKPYVPQFEQSDIFKIGWLDNSVHKLAETKDDSRFNK